MVPNSAGAYVYEDEEGDELEDIGYQAVGVHDAGRGDAEDEDLYDGGREEGPEEEGQGEEEEAQCEGRGDLPVLLHEHVD